MQLAAVFWPHQPENAGGVPAGNGAGRCGGLAGPDQRRDAPLGGIPKAGEDKPALRAAGLPEHPRGRRAQAGSQEAAKLPGGGGEAARRRIGVSGGGKIVHFSVTTSSTQGGVPHRFTYRVSPAAGHYPLPAPVKGGSGAPPGRRSCSRPLPARLAARPAPAPGWRSAAATSHRRLGS